jgi:hypothetical protein
MHYYIALIHKDAVGDHAFEVRRQGLARHNARLILPTVWRRNRRARTAGQRRSGRSRPPVTILLKFRARIESGCGASKARPR